MPEALGPYSASSLWSNTSPDAWRAALTRYEAAIESQGVSSLAEHDRWYRDELPAAVAERAKSGGPVYVTLDELVRVTRWKMSRGAWRARNLVLVQANGPDEVERVTGDAAEQMPHPTRPVATVSALGGVGPATASAVLAALAPAVYPFFEDLVADQVPELGPVKYTLGYYARYAEQLRERAAALGAAWSATDVERALWAFSGGKVARG